MLKTRLCRHFGIDYPILSAPLGGGNAGPELAAAVSDAGGLGFLGMGGLPASAIREQIRDTRRRTSKPFGVGLLLPLLEGGEVEVCVEERVPLLLLFWGDAAPHVEKAKRAGIRVIAQVGSVAEAQAAADVGVDAIVAQGFEAVSMGTRFLASDESRASREYKQRVVRARAEDTVHTTLFDIGWPDAPHRVLRNKAVDEWEAAGCPPSGHRPGEGTTVGRMPIGGAMTDVPRYFAGNPMLGFEGDLEYTALYAGESCSLVNDIRPAAAIVRDILAEAEAALGELRA